MKKSILLTLALSAIPFAAQANIVNGDFEAGNTGFTSGYTYVAPTHNALYPEGLYTVDTNASNVHDQWASFGDHTTGTGKYLIVNGTNAPGTVVWQGSNDTNLTIGKTYTLTAWLANSYPSNPASLSFDVNGSPVSTPFTATGVGVWNKFTANFVATSTNANLAFSIYDNNLNLGGNDFAVDDISLTQAVPEPCSMAALGLGGLALLRRRRKSA